VRSQNQLEVTTRFFGVSMKPQVQIDAELVNFSTKLTRAKQLMRLVFCWLRPLQHEFNGWRNHPYKRSGVGSRCKKISIESIHTTGEIVRNTFMTFTKEQL
jgi:hypothetical protein